MRIGMVGGSYTVQSNAVADEESINFFTETMESQGAMVRAQAYGGQAANPLRSLYGTPGLKVFSALPESPLRGSFWANNRLFVVAGSQFVEISSTGAQTIWGDIPTDGTLASISFNGIQLLIVSAGRAYCFTLATNNLLDVTAQLAGTPVQCYCSDTYFVVCFENSNKYQMSQLLDGTTWPGQLVNEVSVFPDNIVGMMVNHRELWIFGPKQSQPFQNTGSAEVFDPVPGALIETGMVGTFAVARLDNSVFWVGLDERGALIASRSSGYTPARSSTHAVEVWLSRQANIANLVTYSYQDRGHLFWVLYVPGGDCTWVYDVGESLWHKRAFWTGDVYEAHHSWNHVYAFGKHLVGDWKSGNLYEMSFDYYDDAGSLIRRLRRPPTVSNEKQWMYHIDLTLDFEAGLGPQPPLVDGNNAPRPPQVMLRWSNDSGKTWSNEQIAGCGMAGEYDTRVVFRRLGRSRNRVYEMTVTDPIQWTLIDAYLRLGNG